MRIALVQDQLLGHAGSERVFSHIMEAFPDADVFTLAYNPALTLAAFAQRAIHTSWLNRLVTTHARFKLSFPLATYVMQGMDFTSYDVVLTSSASTAKYVTTGATPHVCYCYIPTRAIWNTGGYFTSDSITSSVFRALLPYLRRRDYDAARGVDQFIAISNESRRAIRSSYGRDARVLMCPVDTEKFGAGMLVEKGSNFLLVSRLERWKRVDYAIEAFNDLGLPLTIVGAGEDETRLRSLAGSTITFLGAVDDERLAREYGQARAVIFTPEIEYGLIPLEANAAGTPVIAFGTGGVLETQVPFVPVRHSPPPTAIFFHEQSARALKRALFDFERATFRRIDLRRHAEQFGIASFQDALRAQVETAARCVERKIQSRGNTARVACA